MDKKVRISAFPAHLRPVDCNRYIEGHSKILSTYGVTKVTSANYDWKYGDFTYLIIVESLDSEKILGGARIQLASNNVKLPIETAINDLDLGIFNMVREKSLCGTAEFCGLWNSREVAGYGIGSIILGRVGVAIISQLPLGSLFAFASQATVKNCEKVGFQTIYSLGINGTFYYPKEDLLATAMIIEDPAELKHAEPLEREMIFSLRENPKQVCIEKGPRGALEIDYDITIPLA